uniref:Mitochondrial glutathione transporter SLC25A40 n=1 Tax=Electrophorus electricus TaxID=8005 RepID=A0A4W4E869_ELEEL
RHCEMTSPRSQASVDSITPLQQMMASCSGALLTSLFVTPLDVIKIRLQAQRSPFPKGKCFVYCNGLMDHICVCENGNGKAWYKPRGHFNGTLDAFIKIVRTEGFKSLWSGLPPTLVMAVPATVIYFTCYDQLCSALRFHMNDQGRQGAAIVGSATLISPLELIRTKLQSERQSYRELSARRLLRGLGPTLLRDVPFSALYWYNYEKGKAWLCRSSGSREPTFSITFIAGAVSGSIASVVTLPFDVVKTRRQVELGELQLMINLIIYTFVFVVMARASSSTYSVMKRIVTENGIRGLFVGFTPRLIKVAPACAIMISVYEFGKAAFRKRNQQRRGPTALQNSST